MIHNTTSMTRLVNEGMREWGIALHGVGKTMEEAKESVKIGYRFPQIAYMSCGNKVTFQSEEKLPCQNVPCSCGNPNHWIVKYDLLPQPLSRWRRLLSFLHRPF